MQQTTQGASSFGVNLAAGVTGALAGAAVKTAINGRDFGDNLMSLLPDAIGATIGNALADAVTGASGADTGEAAPNGNALWPGENPFGLHNLHMGQIGYGFDWDHFEPNNIIVSHDPSDVETVVVNAARSYSGGGALSLAMNSQTPEGYWRDHPSRGFPSTSMYSAPAYTPVISEMQYRFHQGYVNLVHSQMALAQMQNASFGDSVVLYAQKYGVGLAPPMTT